MVNVKNVVHVVVYALAVQLQALLELLYLLC